MASAAVSTAVLLGAPGLILDALAGFLGGPAGAVDPTITSRGLAGERRV